MKNFFILLSLLYFTDIQAQKLELIDLIHLSEMKEEDDRDVFFQKHSFVFSGEDAGMANITSVQNYKSKQRKVRILFFSFRVKDYFEQSFSVDYNTPDLAEKQKMIDECKKLGYIEAGEFIGKSYKKKKSDITFSTRSETDKTGKPYKNYIISVSVNP